MTTTFPPPVETKRASGRLWLGLGALLVLAGPLIYVGQMQLMGRLTLPKYGPYLATAGLLLLLVAVWRRPNIWRIGALVFFGLVTAGQWFGAIAGSTPPYNGPATAGKTIPAFEAKLADGTRFDQDSLPGEQNTVLLFFRGHW